MGHFEHSDDPCFHCGACLSLCLWDQFERENPGQAGSADLCRDCMLCYNICARVHPAESFSGGGFFEPSARHPLLGVHRSVSSGRATERVALAQDGGATTALLLAMMEQGMIDGAAVVGRDEEWHAQGKLARTVAEVAGAAGSKYTTAPALADLAYFAQGCERLAVVCLPCQTTALRNMMHKGPKGFSPDRIVAILGVFCYESFRYEGIKALVEGQHELPLPRTTRFDIKKNRLQFFHEGETEPRGNVPLTEVKHLAWPICHSCLDFTAELADVSLGAVGSKAGENTILVRTPRGQEVVDLAVKMGYLQLEAVRNLGLVERISENKRKRRAELSAEDARFLLKQTLRGNYKKAKLKGQW